MHLFLRTLFKGVCIITDFVKFLWEGCPLKCQSKPLTYTYLSFVQVCRSAFILETRDSFLYLLNGH